MSQTTATPPYHPFPAPLDTECQVAWMPPGQTPTDADFVQQPMLDPDDPDALEAELPIPNPEAWWRLDEAVTEIGQKIALGTTGGKEPWVCLKGGRLLNTADVMQVHAHMRRLGLLR